MKALTWGLQILLALAFAATGSMKLATPKAELEAQAGMGWAGDFSQGQIRAIGAAEVGGAVGLVAPAALGVLPVLTPVAAGSLAALMGGAAYTHVRRGESPAVPLVLGTLALVVVVLRVRAGNASGGR